MKNLLKKTNRNLIMKNMFFTCSIVLLLNSGTSAQGVQNSKETRPQNDVISRARSMNSSTYDVINLIDGKKIIAVAVHADTNILSYMEVKKHGTRIKKCDLSHVYSVINTNGVEKIYYQQDTTSNDHYMTMEEEIYYVAGAQDARSNFKAPVSTITGVFTGAATAVVGFWSVPLLFVHPYVCASITSSKNAKPLDKAAPNTDVSSPMISVIPEPTIMYGKMFATKKPGQIVINDFKYNKKSILQNCYNMGYRDAASEKKCINAIKGNVGGFAGVLLLVLMVL